MKTKYYDDHLPPDIVTSSEETHNFHVRVHLIFILTHFTCPSITFLREGNRRYSLKWNVVM